MRSRTTWTSSISPKREKYARRESSVDEYAIPPRKHLSDMTAGKQQTCAGDANRGKRHGTAAAPCADTHHARRARGAPQERVQYRTVGILLEYRTVGILVHVVPSSRNSTNGYDGYSYDSRILRATPEVTSHSVRGYDYNCTVGLLRRAVSHGSHGVWNGHSAPTPPAMPARTPRPRPRVASFASRPLARSMYKSDMLEHSAYRTRLGRSRR